MAKVAKAVGDEPVRDAYALPPEKRRVADSDYVWAYYVREVECDMPGALAQVEELVAMSGREGWADGRGRDTFAYLLGLSNDLSIDEAAALEIRRAQGHALMQAAVASDDPDAVLRAHFEEQAP